VKTHQIEVQRVKAMSNSHGTIQVQIDALVQNAAPRDDGAPTSELLMSEDTARVLLLLIKGQLAEFDSRKARSRRG